MINSQPELALTLFMNGNVIVTLLFFIPDTFNEAQFLIQIALLTSNLKSKKQKRRRTYI